MKPDEPHWHSRGYLPHRHDPAVIQFATFLLQDALPVHVQKRLQALRNNEANRPETARLFQMSLDAGYGRCELRCPEIASLVEKALLFFDGTRYRLHAWVVMPSHVHVVLTLSESEMLAKVIRSWKSYTARRANAILERHGTFWHREYYDRYIRNARHLDDVVRYVHNNPVKAGLAARPEAWPWSSAGRRASGELRLSCDGGSG